MCQAFSCIVTPTKALWRFGVDSHTELLEHFKLKDDTAEPAELAFARVEITPSNRNYLSPDVWKFKIDQSITPAWWSARHEAMAWGVHREWVKNLDAILVRKPIVHPFKLGPPEITEKHVRLLRDWASVWDSVWDSVGASVWDSVGANVWDSVRASVWDSVWDSVGDSVGDSVRAYTGSFFNLPRKAWKYTETIKTKDYPFASAVKLWEAGLVPSFDGKIWRLHGGPKGKQLFQISAEELRAKVDREGK